MPKIHPSDLVNYFFPVRCLICEHIVNQQNSICIHCSSKLKYSFCEKALEQNELTDLFRGRADLQQAFYFLQFDPDGVAKKIVHEIKYNANFALMEKLGVTIQHLIKDKLTYDYILPVPLNSKKLKERGYNQSEVIAESIFGKDRLLPNLVVRTQHTKSQTTFGKFQRWENIKDAFEVNLEVSQKVGPNKTILLVDDVVTTGSTLESILALLKVNCPEYKFSILALLKA